MTEQAGARTGVMKASSTNGVGIIRQHKPNNETGTDSHIKEKTKSKWVES